LQCNKAKFLLFVAREEPVLISFSNTLTIFLTVVVVTFEILIAVLDIFTPNKQESSSWIVGEELSLRA